MAVNPMKLAAGLQQVAAGPYDFPGSRQFRRGDTTPAERFGDAAAEQTMSKVNKPTVAVPKIVKPKGIKAPTVKGDF